MAVIIAVFAVHARYLLVILLARQLVVERDVHVLWYAPDSAENDELPASPDVPTPLDTRMKQRRHHPRP